MQAYFSHSYRDVPINTYFSELFDAANISLRADRKSEVWCMAKLERYMFEMGGLVSIIPRRIAADESITYSPYIGRELMLARRARAPRILFVDDQVLNSHRADFPATAVPFFHDAPETERARHVELIDQFRRDLAGGLARPPRRYVEKRATVIAGKEPLLRDAASHVAAILRAKTYNPTVKNAAGLDQAFDDIDVFESLLDSELCVFVLDKELSHSDLLLAMAHAHCIPSVRLRHDPEATSSDPELSGVVRWKSAEELRPRFLKVFENYLNAFEEPSGKKDLQRLGTPSAGGSEWDPSDGPGLLAHIQPEDSYVGDRVDGVMRGLASLEKSRLHSDRVCRSLYDRIKKERFYYTYEPASAQKAAQRIRTPTEIGALNCGTCIDYVCMFASMLEAAHEEPVVVVIRTGGRAHAVAGYCAPDAIAWDSPPHLGDLRGAINSGEVVLFETTGAVEARDGTVAAETESERREGGSMLDYQTAKDAAKRLIGQNDVEVTHFIDVKQARLNRA